jgi:hypothetical protein
MKMNTHSASSLCRALIASAASIVIAGCASGSSNTLAPIQAAQTKNIGNFSNTIFLGDSLTAGYQSGSLLDTHRSTDGPPS